MRRTRIGFCILLAALCAAAAGAKGLGPAPPPPDLTVHEWGTFLSVQGSDGVTLDGMYHEEHALPSFVHARSRDQLHLPSAILKGETPVIYFYTPRRQDVRVTVDFPEGIWTQWFPQARVVSPKVVPGADEPTRGGKIVWCGQVIPPSELASGTRPPVAPEGSLWNFARQVDSAYVVTQDPVRQWAREYERFLFYRGLGQAPLPLTMNASDNGSLETRPDGPRGVRHVFVLRVEKGRGAYRYLPEARPGELQPNLIPSMASAQPLPEFTRRLSDDLAARLVESGLYAKEARAMVNTWKNSYFQTDGVRALFVMPQAWTDRFIPISIAPRPKRIVRVMVGRLEMLTPEREKLSERAIGELAADDPSLQERGFRFLRDQGRYLEPIIRRVRRTTASLATRALCDRLLQTRFVTELHAEVGPAGGGANDDPARIRFELAQLLNEIGAPTETREGAAF